MKNYNKPLYLLVLIFVLSSCVKEDYFGRSALKQILFFSLQQQTGNARIVEDSLRIYVTVTADADITSLKIDSFRISTFAALSPGIDLVQDFSEPVNYTVTAENGSSSVYTVFVVQEGSEPQLENSGFDDWYTPSGKAYKQPGKDLSTLWASANDGVTTTGSGNFNTTPLLIAGTDYAAQLVTKDLGSIAQISGQRMGTATLFTGKFVLNIANPPASPQFGVPFTARPSGFTVNLNYKEGTPYKDGKNNILNKTDSADIYLLLENRDNPNAIKRIATGWYRAGNSPDNNYENITVTLVYGNLPAGTPDYQKPVNGLYGSASDKITHITVVFASSANGIVYEGGVNSILLVNNFALHY